MAGWGSFVFSLIYWNWWESKWKERRWLLQAVAGAEAQSCLIPRNAAWLSWSDSQHGPDPSAEPQDLPREVFAVDPTTACQTVNTEVLYRCRKCRYFIYIENTYFYIFIKYFIFLLKTSLWDTLKRIISSINQWVCRCQVRDELFPGVVLVNLLD